MRLVPVRAASYVDGEWNLQLGNPTHESRKLGNDTLDFAYLGGLKQ